MKVRMCANGSTQRSHIPREKDLSPKVTTNFVLVTIAIDAEQERDVMSMDIPNEFVQTKVSQSDERIIMNIRVALVDMLLETYPKKCKDFVIGKGRNKVFHAHVLNELCGMLMAIILC